MAKIKIKKSTLRYIKYILLALLGILLVILVIKLIPARDGERVPRSERREHGPQEPEKPKEMFGIIYDGYQVETNTIQRGQTLSHILGGMGVSPVTIDRIDRLGRPSEYGLRNIKEGNNYTVFFTQDTSGMRKIGYFIYEKSLTDYVIVSLLGDSVALSKFQKEVTTVRRKETARIETSLWHSIAKADLPQALSSELENIYGWSVDFFHLQEGDEFTVIFDERYIEDKRVGIGRVWGSEFTHRGKTTYAIPFKQDGLIEYWDDKGNSMKKQFLKAPLKYTRISSGYTSRRLHPVHKVYRAHYGVDYAAPSGTPVMAIADGTVTEKRWDSKGGGNILRIRHSNNYVSTYMHLKGYAKNINVGTRVSQGQDIAYVGSTGTSTGPHLDFRMQKNGQYINPLNLPSGTGVPVKEANKAAFNIVRDKVMAELKGDVPDEDKLTSL